MNAQTILMLRGKTGTEKTVQNEKNCSQAESYIFKLDLARAAGMNPEAEFRVAFS